MPKAPSESIVLGLLSVQHSVLESNGENISHFGGERFG